MLIAGPTAGGKSAAALALAADAERRGRPAIIVNADAMQVYAPLSVLTARPGAEEMARAPHRLYGHVAGDVRHSVGAWLDDVAGVLAAAEEEGALPILVGGTGLYFKALTEGLAAVPAIPSETRAALAARLAAEGAEALHAALMARDPEAAESLRPSDGQRIVRALEVLEATGRPLRDWHAERQAPPLVPAEAALRLVVEPDRARLYARIDARLDAMVAAGAVEEVRALLALGLDPALPVMKAIGVRELAAFLDGETTLAEAVARAKQESRRYAKRQLTWFRNQTPGWRRLSGA